MIRTTNDAGTCTRILAAAATVAAIAVSAVAGEGNLLVVVPSGFVGTAPVTQYVNAKSAMGFNVMLYEVASGTSRQTIKNYILSLWGTENAPDYILIIGDTDGANSGTYTIPHWEGGGSKHAATDWPYGCMDAGDDWHPEIPVGRFSARTVPVLQNIVSKSLYVEGGSYPDPDYVARGAFLANPDTAGLAEVTHDWVINNYFVPNDYEAIRIYAALGGNTQDVINALNDGVVFAVYMGHSSSGGWWDPSFNQSNINSLSNQGLYPLVFGFSCNTANYPYDECFGETWIRAANKGAAAYISASNYIYWGSYDAWLPSAILERSYFRSFFELDIWEIGPAWVAGLYNFEAEYGGSTDVERNFFEEFVILGDPSLRLPQPSSFRIQPDPLTQAVCAPPTDEVSYSIEVRRTGTFTEAVTLELSEYPPGASVAFSVNSLPPPFTTVLTVGNLSAVPPDKYSMVLTATAPSLQRTTALGLSIASAAPQPPGLLEPPDGASQVALLPSFTWQELADADAYDLEVATDAAFANVVYTASVRRPQHTVTSALESRVRYFWHVRASNACGAGEWSQAFSFRTVGVVEPVAYDMLNGETGSYTYFDDTYNGQGDNRVPLAPLSGGLGDLTDGVIATQHWNATPVLYVGWRTIDPTITFHFDPPVNINTVTLYVDDSGGGGAVYAPDDVRIVMGGTTLQFVVIDPPGNGAFAVSFTDLGLSGDTLELTLADHNTSQYMMLSEVDFLGEVQVAPCPGDLDDDRDVDLADLAILLAHYGVTEGAAYGDGDLDGDGDVDLADLSALLAAYGTTCE